MAKATAQVINALRKTVNVLEKSDAYQWGHMGSCNCGFLAQHVTKLSKQEIHARAMLRHGDWNEQLNDYCSTSGLPMDDLISDMLTFGFDSDDLKHLERLSDKNVLQMIPVLERSLSHNVKTDVITYLKAWIQLLENRYISSIDATNILKEREPAFLLV